MSIGITINTALLPIPPCGFSPDPGRLWILPRSGGNVGRGVHAPPWGFAAKILGSPVAVQQQCLHTHVSLNIEAHGRSPPLADIPRGGTTAEGKTDQGFPPFGICDLKVSIPHQITDIKGEIPDLSCLLLSNRLYGEFASWL